MSRGISRAASECIFSGWHSVYFFLMTFRPPGPGLVSNRSKSRIFSSRNDFLCVTAHKGNCQETWDWVWSEPEEVHHGAKKSVEGSERVKSLGQGGRGAPAENNWGEHVSYISSQNRLANTIFSSAQFSANQQFALSAKEKLFNRLIKYSLNINLVTIRNWKCIIYIIQRIFHEYYPSTVTHCVAFCNSLNQLKINKYAFN